jgi:hypothetical protein
LDQKEEITNQLDAVSRVGLLSDLIGDSGREDDDPGRVKVGRRIISAKSIFLGQAAGGVHTFGKAPRGHHGTEEQ